MKNEFLYSTKFKYFAMFFAVLIPSALLANLLFTPNDTIYSSAKLSNGSIIIGGAFGPDFIAKLTSSGTLDSNFSKDWKTGGFNDTVRAISIQSDGKILVGGDFTRFDVSLAGYIVRLNSDGTIDSSFSIKNGTGFDDTVRSVSVQPDGKILVGGDFIMFNGTEVGSLARLNPDGSLDSSFTVGKTLDGSVFSISADSDKSSVFFAGTFSDYLKKSNQ